MTRRFALGLLGALSLSSPSVAQVSSTAFVPSAIISSILPVYDAAGAMKTPSHVDIGSCTLSAGACTVTLSGAAAFTDATTYFCNANDKGVAAVAASANPTSGTSFTIAGTLSHTVSWSCMGW